jgi:N utilization substance protein A
MKGMRVQSIIRELRGEKIDIIEYNEDTAVFAANSLSPAKINRVVILDGLSKHLEVIVDDNQLSLAIGKKGQNVRLASKLIGWRIDIKSEEEKRQEVESQMEQLVPGGTPIAELAGIGAKTVDKLVERGITTVEKLGEMTPEQLQEIPGIGPKMVEKIRLAVNNYYSQFDEGGAGAGEWQAGAAEASSGPGTAVESEEEAEEEAEKGKQELTEAAGDGAERDAEQTPGDEEEPKAEQSDEEK